jgi:GNAT superfamily N-acetyltransferase
MPSTAKQLAIRTMTRDDLPVAIEWAAREGWNPGLYDAVPFGTADPGGFLVGTLDGEPVAVVSAVRYGSRFGFLGFYIVRPDCRGRGYGKAIWEAAMAQLRGRVVGLDGVIEQQDNYRRSGFELAHRNMRFEGVAGAAAVHPAAAGAGLVPLAEVPEAALLDYDRAFFPAERIEFLRQWIAQPGTVALAALQGGRLLGYGVLRPCRVGFKIGPLFADSADVAERIFSELQRHVPADVPFYLDIPACNPEALALVGRHGMKPVFETARMYLGSAPELALDRTYGITSFELG